MLELIRDPVFFIYYYMRKYPLHGTSALGTRQNTLYITWSLVNVNNSCDLLRYSRSTTKWVIRDTVSLHPSSISIFLQEVHTQSFHPTPLGRGSLNVFA